MNHNFTNAIKNTSNVYATSFVRCEIQFPLDSRSAKRRVKVSIPTLLLQIRTNLTLLSARWLCHSNVNSCLTEVGTYLTSHPKEGSTPGLPARLLTVPALRTRGGRFAVSVPNHCFTRVRLTCAKTFNGVIITVRKIAFTWAKRQLLETTNYKHMM